MLEVLLNGMLIKSNFYRNISFKKGPINSVEFDSNYSIIKVTYIEGSMNFDIMIPGAIVYKEMELTIEGSYEIKFAPIIINGIKFHQSKSGLEITQVIVKNLTKSKVVYQEPLGIGIAICPVDAGFNLNQDSNERAMTAQEYVDLVNEIPEIYSEIEDESKFLIANFTSVNFKYRNKVYRFNNVHPYSNEVIYTDEIIIINGFLDFLAKEYPQYDFKTRPIKQNDEESKEIDNKSPNETIYYTTYLGKESDKNNTRPLISDVYDTIRNTEIEVRFEYVADDLNSTMKFREEFIMQREFSNKRNFKYKDSSGELWDASVQWSSLTGNDFPSDPKMYPELSPLDLNSFEFKADVLGIICRRKDNPSKVAEAILKLITKDDERILVRVRDENIDNTSD